MRCFFALVLAAACGSSHPNGSIDAPNGGGGDDAAAIDAPLDAGAGCVPLGTPVAVSGDTPAAMTNPLVASNGTSTIVAWDVSPVTLDRAAWAEIQSGAVIANGTFDEGFDTASAQLLVLNAKIYLFQHTGGANGLWAYAGSAWSQVAGFSADHVVVSGSTLFGIQTPINQSISVIAFDGTTASSPTTISPHRFANAAGDDAGGLGVLTTDAAQMTLYFASYSGGHWTPDATIGSPSTPPGSTHLAHSGTLWGAIAVPLTSGAVNAWVDSGGVWTASLPGLTSYSAFAGSSGRFAVSDLLGKVSVYTGTWTAKQVISTTSIDYTPRLAAFGNGFVFHMANQAAIFDGTSWGTALPTGLNSAAGLVVSGSSIAAWSGSTVSLFDSAWTPTAIGSAAIAAFSGSDVVAAYVTPGVVTARTAAAGTWGSSLALPVYATSGAVVQGELARAGNGHVLAIWEQYSNGSPVGLASEFDGCSWGTPVSIPEPPTNGAAVAASGSTFVLADITGARVGAWTGSGIGSYTSFSNLELLASDGATLVVVWALGGGPTQYATSTDGVAWTPSQATGLTGNLDSVVGGPAGVLAWTVSGTTITASLLQHGTWSATTTLTASTTCQGSVAGTTALLACPNGASTSVALYANGAWTAVPAGDSNFTIANDGTDYRMDYALYTAMPSSVVLHDGRWSSPATSSPLSALNTAGRNGTWLMIGVSPGTDGSHYFRQSATGSGGYTTATMLVATPIIYAYSLHPFASSGTDALLVSGHPAGYRAPALYVALHM